LKRYYRNQVAAGSAVEVPLVLYAQRVEINSK
jgi:hypothetical protein